MTIGPPNVDQVDDYTLYQTSTIATLLAGVYDGDVTVHDLLQHGDFGLGTFNHLDGEMIVIDGICFQLRSDGSATVAAGNQLTPFAAVTHFVSHTQFYVTQETSLRALTEAIDSIADGVNVPLAVRLDGEFRGLRTRTVREQNKPYRPLVEAVGSQAINTLEFSNGTIAGFRTPGFEEAISVAGYHLHYIDSSRTSGGHLLDATMTSGRVAIAPLTELHLRLNNSAEARNATINLETLSADQHKAEGSPAILAERSSPPAALG